MALLEGPLTATFSIPLDLNNDLDTLDTGFRQDTNFNGVIDSSPLKGFDDWFNIDMRQKGARRGALGFSADVWGGDTDSFGGDADSFGGDADSFGGDTDSFGGDTDSFGGDADSFGGGVPETDFDVANSTVDPPVALTCTNCVKSSTPWVEGGKSVPLAWTPPGFGQIRTYYIWRANITNVPMSKTNPPVNIGKVTGTPPTTSFTDSTVKNNNTYLYFVTAALGAASGKNSGNQSGPSNQVQILVK
jgi:hypothetical protein